MMLRTTGAAKIAEDISQTQVRAEGGALPTAGTPLAGAACAVGLLVLGRTGTDLVKHSLIGLNACPTTPNV